ncbi:hypothetical protein NE236_38510 [Actinoallomurus purpureus]|uniref:hypothetical protein n=1 Tax=Actinoallomurus purpureus TaxID=478114 RepID=UPI002092E6C0|nr:hypothetical protein [Actinoallomurus purpureus]MCO6010867.1 hypothetical protein [Actinoallomurus purpureus]
MRVEISVESVDGVRVAARAGFGGTWLSGMLVDLRPRLVMFGTTGLMATALATLGAGIHLQPLLRPSVSLSNPGLSVGKVRNGVTEA